MQTLGDFSRMNARRGPEKVAVRLDGETLTYRELDDMSNALGRALASGGIGTGDRVALLASNCPEFVVVSQAVAKIGAVLVPINTRFVADEVRYVLEHCEAEAFLVESEYAQTALAAVRGLANAPRLFLLRGGDGIDGTVSLASLIAGQPTETLPTSVDPASPAVIMYTSGTTGAPKGVLISHEKYMRIFLAVAVELDVREEDICQAAVPLFHNGGFATVLNPALMVGATVVCYRGSFDPEKVLSDIERHRITLVHWVPTMLAMVQPHAESGAHDLSSLKKIQFGAMPISPQVLAAARRTFRADFYQGYGTTDAGKIACLRPSQFDQRSTMTGRPVFNTSMRIVDDNGRDVAVGEIGEIIVDAKTSGMIGYWKDEETTAKVMKNGWIHTGDMARQESAGFFSLVDRKGFMIISGGENIYPAEVEVAIASHPAVREVAVFGVSDSKFGEAVCAAVVPKPGATADLESLRAFCEGRISRYKLPRHLLVLDELPRTALGKIAKGLLKDMFAEQVLSTER